MAAGLFTVLKNISMLMDDTASMTKIALKDTVAVLGDDLAVNAEKASKFNASRELPVVWAITKGSILNKIIIVPIILFLSYLAPWLIKPILVIGGAFLAYEGYHGVKEMFLSHEESEIDDEAVKVKSAIQTDRILSIEIIVIALNSVSDLPFSQQLFIVSIVALIATIGIYGVVALIIRLDDIGQWMMLNSIKKEVKKEPCYKVESNGKLFKENVDIKQNIYMLFIGDFLINSMGKIIKALTYIGIFAMFLVSGEIFLHNLLPHYLIENIHGFTTLIAIILSFIVGFTLDNLLKRIKNEISKRNR